MRLYWEKHDFHSLQYEAWHEGVRYLVYGQTHDRWVAEVYDPGEPSRRLAKWDGSTVFAHQNEAKQACENAAELRDGPQWPDPISE